MRSTRAGHDQSRRDAGAHREAERPLSAAEQSWLLEQLARRPASATAVRAAARPGESSIVIERDSGAAADAVPSPRVTRVTRGGVLLSTTLPVAPAGEGASAAPMPAAPSEAVGTAPESTETTPPTRAHRAALEGLKYRAVFACARCEEGAPPESR